MSNYIRVSSLGSYFGVGFNDPETQYRIDTGLEVQEFDEEATKRINLGKFLEDSSLNYFQNYFSAVITNRNTKTLVFYNDKLHGKLDGMMSYEGEDVVVENKISNSQSGKFTEDAGYVFQVQAYMLATNTKRALLCGLFQGKPIHKFIERDEGIIEDIKTMTDFVVGMMDGVNDFKDYPWYLVTKYSGKTELPKMELNDGEILVVHQLRDIKAEIRKLEEAEAMLENTIKSKYSSGKFTDGSLTVTLSEYTRSGGYDLDAFSINNPEIDLTPYKKADTTFKTLRIK